MEIIPAIDIRNGKCVRLFKGLESTAKIYSENPLEILKMWINHNAKRIHIIDLDKAWNKGSNENLIKVLLKEASNKVRIQIGGGIRNIAYAMNFLKAGADRIILGTLAINNPEEITRLSKEVGKEHIMVAIDYKLNNVAINGWRTQTTLNPFTLAKDLTERGAGYVLFSSIEADGTLEGPDLKNIAKLTQTIDPAKIYVAGGIKDTNDINDLRDFSIKGVIIGKAFYENRIPLSIINDSIYKQ